MQPRLAILQNGETLALSSRSPKGAPQVGLWAANGGITFLKSTCMSDQATKRSKYRTKYTGKAGYGDELTSDSDLESEYKRSM